jgi:hypothetical protein
MKALTHEEQVKPVRGTNMKPIHLRSRKYMQIKRLANDDVVYWDGWASSGEPNNEHDYIVKWKPNGEIHIQARMYNCMYEQLTSLLGVEFCREKNHLWVCIDNQWLALRSAFGKDPSILKWVTNTWGDNVLVYTNPPTLTQKAINRGVAKAVRAKYRRVYDYLRSMSKLHESEFTFEEFGIAFDIQWKCEATMRYWDIQRLIPKIELGAQFANQDNIVEMVSLANEGDLVMSHKLMLACAWAAGERHHWSNSSSVDCVPDKLVKAFDDFVLRIHREEVFYDKDVPTGKTPSTTNDKFFR